MSNPYPIELINDIRLRNVVPFIGTGYSIPSGIPSWNQLITELINELNDEYGADDIEILYNNGIIDNLDAPEIYNILNKGKFKLKKMIKDKIDKNLESNEFHHYLYQFYFDTIITTNYDKLIEDHYLKSGSSINKIWKNKQLAFFDDKRSTQLIKIHGTIEDVESVVLSLSDYKNYIKKHKPIYSVISSFFLTKSILFLGFSLQDPNIIKLLEELRISTSSNIRNHYAVLYHPSKEEIVRIRALGIKIINLEGEEIMKTNLEWLNGLFEKSKIIGKTNIEKAFLINQGLKEELSNSIPGAVIRMRANLGILSNPKSIPDGITFYGTKEQDDLEIEMGNLARKFLAKNVKNKIKCILYINPDHSLKKGYSNLVIIERLMSIHRFLNEFPEQIELVQANDPIDLNHIIIAERTSFITLQRARETGYDRILRKDNRWVLLSEIEVFDYDFDALKYYNRVIAINIGINVEEANWTNNFIYAVIDNAIIKLKRQETLYLVGHSGEEGIVNRKIAHEQGLLHYSVHLHIINSSFNRILVQKRSKAKDLLANMFNVSVSGHPESMNLKKELLREVAEELSIWFDEDDIKFGFDLTRLLENDNEIVKVYYVVLNENDILKISRFSQFEVECIYWLDVDEIISNEFTLSDGYIMVNCISVPSKRNLVVNDFVPGSLLEMKEIIKFAKVNGRSD